MWDRAPGSQSFTCTFICWVDAHFRGLQANSPHLEAARYSGKSSCGQVEADGNAFSAWNRRLKCGFQVFRVRLLNRGILLLFGRTMPA
jgi:hypothetical protein